MIRLDGPSGSFWLRAPVTRPTRVESRMARHRPLFADRVVARRPPNPSFGENIWRPGMVGVQTEVHKITDTVPVHHDTSPVHAQAGVTYDGEPVTHDSEPVTYAVPVYYDLDSGPANEQVSTVRARAREATTVSTPYWLAQVVGCTLLIVRPVADGFVLEIEWAATEVGPPEVVA